MLLVLGFIMFFDVLFVNSKQDITLNNEICDRYYYEKLSDDYKKAYLLLFENIYLLNDSINIEQYNISHADFGLILNSIFYDNSEIFWVDIQKKGTYFYNSEDYVTEVHLNYLYTVEEVEQYKQEIDIIVDEVISKIPDNLNDYNKIKYLFYYTHNNALRLLNEEALDGQTIYHYFINKEAVCGGYSKSFNYLAKKIGINVIYVEGNYKDMPHAWNILEINNKFYHLDVSFGFELGFLSGHKMHYYEPYLDIFPKCEDSWYLMSIEQLFIRRIRF